MAIIDWTDAELNAKADDTAGRIDGMGIHDGDPGAAGTANEATGGTPAYARVDPAFAAAGVEGALGATDQPATVGVAWGAPSFDLPAGDWTHYSFWSGATFVGSGSLPTTYSVVSDSTYAPNVGVGPGSTGSGV